MLMLEHPGKAIVGKRQHASLLVVFAVINSSLKAAFPNAARATGACNWATIVTHDLRWPLCGLR